MLATTQRVGSLVATGGNPDLSRICRTTSIWAPNGITSPTPISRSTCFNKTVTNFIVAGSTQQTINDVIDPTTGPPAIFTVTQQRQRPHGECLRRRIRAAAVFGDTGFGFQANATLVGTNKPYNPDIDLHARPASR